MQVKGGPAALVGHQPLPGVVREQSEHVSTGDRLASVPDSDGALEGIPVELVQFSPRDHPVGSAALKLIATKHDDDRTRACRSDHVPSDAAGTMGEAC